MKIVIFGSNGMLGNYFTNYFKGKYEILPLTRNNINLATSNEQQIIDFMGHHINDGDVILNAAGIIKQRTFNQMEMIKLNSIFPHILSEFKKTVNCNVVHISTDCVYSGIDGDYTEKSNHDCLDEYGKTKSLGENENITIIRTSIIGEEIHNKKSLVEWVISQKNNTIDGYKNHLWNGVTCLELSKYIDDIIQNKNFWNGVKHIFSPVAVNKYELVGMINDIYELNITIKEKNTVEKCFRNLNTIYENPIKKDLKIQIQEMKNFKIK